MKNTIRTAALSLFLAAVAIAYGEIPPMNVTVSDSGGKAAFKGSVAANGSFATPKLKPGNYVVQFNSKSPAAQGSHYTIVVSAGTKKVGANAVAGEKFSKGGVAMKVEVGNGLNITGQIAAEGAGPISKSGKKMVWIPKRLGSNMPGHWVEEGSAEAMEAKTAGSMSTDDLRNRQDKGVGLIGQ